MFFYGSRYQYNLNTIIGTKEEYTSGNLEQAIGHFASTMLDAE